MRNPTRTSTVILAATAAVLLTAASLLGIALELPQNAMSSPGNPTCNAPALPGTTVHVTLGDMGAWMMGPPMMRGGMWVTAERTSIGPGEVSLLVTNAGHLPHELMVLPLPQGQNPGLRTVGPDGRVNETGFVAEASATCAEGKGIGILPRASSWVTVNLPAGRYELLCNYPGHYPAGMYTDLTIS
jgi:uncharacterized cupredoxin-like copper-binding protein